MKIFLDTNVILEYFTVREEQRNKRIIRNMTQDTKKTMKMKRNILRHLLMMAVMMVVGAVGAWGQIQ